MKSPHGFFSSTSPSYNQWCRCRPRIELSLRSLSRRSRYLHLGHGSTRKQGRNKSTGGYRFDPSSGRTTYRWCLYLQHLQNGTHGRSSLT